MCRASTLMRPRPPKPWGLSAPFTPKNVGVFCHSLAAVTLVAQALQFSIAKQSEIAPMRNDVINLRCLDTQSTPGALPAERLLGQLIIPSTLPPVARVSIPAMPVHRLRPIVPGLVVWAVPGRSQNTASRV